MILHVKGGGGRRRGGGEVDHMYDTCVAKKQARTQEHAVLLGCWRCPDISLEAVNIFLREQHAHRLGFEAKCIAYKKKTHVCVGAQHYRPGKSVVRPQVSLPTRPAV